MIDAAKANSDNLASLPSGTYYEGQQHGTFYLKYGSAAHYEQQCVACQPGFRLDASTKTCVAKACGAGWPAMRSSLAATSGSGLALRSPTVSLTACEMAPWSSAA